MSKKNMLVKFNKIKLHLVIVLVATSFLTPAYAQDRGVKKRKIIVPAKHKFYAPVQRGKVVKRVVPKRQRVFRNIRIARPHGHWYQGYGRYRLDRDAYKWLAFTSITLVILDNLNEQQQRAHEQAQIDATSAEVGEVIKWNDGNAIGSVSVIRDGESSSGRHCREFQQTVSIGGNKESAYGTACQQPDGTWEIISTEN